MHNYNHLYYFHAVASEGSIAGAAHKLGVAQGTVSEQVRALERALQVSLFERQPAGLKLSEAGKLAFEQTSVMFRAGERLSEVLGQSRGPLPRTLRIGLTGAAGRAIATDFLLPLLAIPDCVPSVRVGDTANFLRELRDNEFDLVLTENEPVDLGSKGFESILLSRTKLVAVSSPELETSADWQDVSLVHYRPTSAFRWDVEAFLEEQGLRPRIAAESDDALFLLEAATRGAFVAIVPMSVARDAINANRLRVVATVDSEHAGIHAVYKDAKSVELVRDAISILVEYMREHEADAP